MTGRGRARGACVLPSLSRRALSPRPPSFLSAARARLRKILADEEANAAAEAARPLLNLIILRRLQHEAPELFDGRLALAAFDADNGIGCIVITGSEKAFAAGADIAAMAETNARELELLSSMQARKLARQQR